MKDKRISLDQLTDYIEGRLSEEQQREVERILAHSPAARAQLENFRKVLRTLALSPDRPQTEEYLERLEAITPPGLPLSRQAWELLTLAFLPAALRILALVLVLGILTPLALRRINRGSVPPSGLPSESTLEVQPLVTRQPATATPAQASTPAKVILATATPVLPATGDPEISPTISPATSGLPLGATAALNPATTSVQSSTGHSLLIFPEIESSTSREDALSFPR